MKINSPCAIDMCRNPRRRMADTDKGEGMYLDSNGQAVLAYVDSSGTKKPLLPSSRLCVACNPSTKLAFSPSADHPSVQAPGKRIRGWQRRRSDLPSGLERALPR